MSIAPGISSTDLYARCPSISVSCVFTGMTVYPCCSNARSALFPYLRRLLDAPITATTLGMGGSYYRALGAGRSALGAHVPRWGSALGAGARRPGLGARRSQEPGLGYREFRIVVQPSR